MTVSSTRVIDVAGASRIGLRRPRNEDAFGWFADGRLIALADGMGERPHGGIASALALHEAQTCVEAGGLTAAAIDSIDSFGATTWIRAIFGSARGALAAARVTVNVDTKMESALMVGVLIRSQIVVGHAGHSRCYLWRAGSLTQLTSDHRRHPRGLDELPDEERRALRSLVCIPERGVGDASGDDPEITVAPIEEGDFLLLCSNGVSDALSPATLTRHFGSARAARDVVEAILASCDAAGAEDDATAVVVRIGIVRDR